MQDFTEISTLHTVKIAVCYLLDEIEKPISENELYEIVMKSEAVNYFHYNQAIEELLKSGAVTEFEENGVNFLRLEEKGRQSAECYNDYVPYHFRKRLLKSAFAFFSAQKRDKEAKIVISEAATGYNVNCVIGGDDLELMRFSIYAPDLDQADMIKDKIHLNPELFYSKVIEFLLENKEEEFNA
ncbi:MAG: DUF4364 family protein [Oscillospiraceae bacterium]